MRDERTGSVRAVWTDFGGVLTPPIAHTFMTFCASTGFDPGVLMRAVLKVTGGYGTDDVMLPLDTPLVTEREWLRQVAAAVREEQPEETRELVTLADAWFDGRETNLAWVEELRRLRGSGLFVGLLSNMVPAWDAHWRRMVAVPELFDDVVLSFEVGYRKPQPELFALAAARAGARPEECVLVDDLAANCEGARAAGWLAVHFVDTEQTVAQLAELLTKPLLTKAREGVGR